MKLLKIRYKNFFATGNAFIEIDITKYRKSIISGTNGEGKSTVGNAITFALFGSVIKKVTKGQIVNSINGKNCVVECELLDLNNSHYLIRRGIKPNIFEIYKDSVLVDQTLVGDYQDYLEENILKCSYRTFLQTSIISIENYTPFMSLTKASRREFIEDILDIKVFSVMNTLVKGVVSKNKEKLKVLEATFKGSKEKLVLQKAHIEKLESMQAVGVHTLDDKIAGLLVEKQNIDSFMERRREIEKEYSESRKKLNSLIKECCTITTSKNLAQNELSKIRKDISFFSDNTECPTCKQGIHSDHVSEILTEYTSKETGLSVSIQNHDAQISKYEYIESEMSTLSLAESAHNTSVTIAMTSLSRINKSLTELEREKNNLLNSVDITEQKIALKESAAEAMIIRDEIIALTEENDYNSAMLELFKDTGVKSKIVDQYIPVINRLVNEYLDKLDFFVSFNLDSEFSETIKSRHRDDFTYGSFSAGERMRIDIALMFTFRQLAKMRNSFSCNLLLLDEVADASVDIAGIDSLISILDSSEFKDTNICIISHSNKDRFEESFDGSYKFYKRDNFSCMTDLSGIIGTS